MSDEGGARTYYASSGGATIAEYSESGAATTPVWTKNYIYLGARLLATQAPISTGERVEYHHPDRLGTRLVTNNQDALTFEQAHLPFGTGLESESGGATNRRFTSYDRSYATGLDYAVNRHYDPSQGRFTQVDPIGMGAASLGDPQSLNMYAYVGNDPINRIDPDGLFWGKLFKFLGKALKWIAIAAVVATAILTVFAAPLAGTVLGSVLGFIAGIPAAIGGFVAGIGKTVAGVFGFAEAGVSAAVAGLIGNGVLLGGVAGGRPIHQAARVASRRVRLRCSLSSRVSLSSWPCSVRGSADAIERFPGRFAVSVARLCRLFLPLLFRLRLLRRRFDIGLCRYLLPLDGGRLGAAW